jgi:hypothetical protein
MKLLARIFCFWFFASSWLLNQIESITHQEMGMFGNPQIRTHFYIYIYIFSEAVFLICRMRDLRSNFPYKPNETPGIQRKKKKEIKK